MTSAISAPSPQRADFDAPRLRVAICEPDAQLRALLGEWLQRGRYEPVYGAEGAAAADVELVIADVPAPRQDGAASIARLRRHFPQAKVLAISGQFLPGVHGANTAAAALGADAMLAKPFAAKAFVEAVRSLTCREPRV